MALSFLILNSLLKRLKMEIRIISGEWKLVFVASLSVAVGGVRVDQAAPAELPGQPWGACVVGGPWFWNCAPSSIVFLSS